MVAQNHRDIVTHLRRGVEHMGGGGGGGGGGLQRL